ncbi:MAG: DNA repair protein RecN [Bacteroidota bacterium]|nr:DNA repair protein RecN [Bacteroidota bacterium]
MLTSLVIRNFALIEEIRIPLAPGLTVMTGETGAGKSIVIDALGLVLGERADTTMVRQGSAKAVVEAELDAAPLTHLRPMVEEMGAEWQAVLILRREVSSKGVSRAFVNDSPVPVGALHALGNRLVDIHGQHEHQSLLRPETHREILDSDPAVAEKCASFAALYRQFTARVTDLADALRTRDRIDERRLVAEHQLKEIAMVAPEEGEDEAVERELKMVEHAEKLAVAANEILDLLYDGEQNVVDMLGRCDRLFGELTRIDSSIEAMQKEVSGASTGLAEIARSVRDYVEAIDFTPDRAEQLRHRLAEITGLKRKFRCTLPELLEKREELKSELAGLDSIDDTIEHLQRETETLRAKSSTAAAALSNARERAGAQLAKQVVAELAALGIAHAVFETHLGVTPSTAAQEKHLLRDGKAVSADDSGWDEVEFHLSTNLGEHPKPLHKVVSGGEVSRIMLALKSIFAGRDGIPIMVFDEIDVGVSGGIASRVGNAMRKLAAAHQILAITHLPQIAGAGSAHLLVEKHVENGRTTTAVTELGSEARTKEVARLLSGDSVTAAALQSARELLS